jgi:acetolactate synthase I/II/III large subunit
VNGAESLVRTAVAGGVNVCFANPGTTEMPLLAALDSVPGIRSILGLFEGVCTGAADGYGRMTGRPAMTLLHLGPGFANGIANLHNARRARSPVVNVVGEHATWHIAADAPLTSDIVSLARPVSDWLRTSTSAQSLASDVADAAVAAIGPPGRVATLIVPADVQWGAAAGPSTIAPTSQLPLADASRVDAAAQACRNGTSTVLLLGGGACASRGLNAAARIAGVTGCRLFVETFPARLECGAGMPRLERFPYFAEQVPQVFQSVERFVLAGARDPVAMFGYPGGTSRMLPAETAVLTLAQADEDVAASLEDVADVLRAPPHAAKLSPPSKPARPSGGLDVVTLATAVGALLPENAIVVDEGATSSLLLFDTLATALPSTLLMLTGGAIGQGIPCATGAAVACPDRKVVAVQADGSAMYTLQALWTQARESLDVTTLLCSNRSYRILQLELHRAGHREAGATARALTELAPPVLDWVKLAEGMGVPALRVESADALVRALEIALAEPGPHLLELMLA